MSFDNFGLNPSICRALKESGYTHPTPIQSLAIPEVLSGKDILASADTGTGKTAAFMLPALHYLTSPSKVQSKGPRVLVLTPTRELATQVTNAAKKYGKHLSKLRTVSILGGMPYEPQRRDLRNFVDILVATPGRLLDHHRAGMIDFGRLELLVLDEADRMLDMGFYEDVETVTKSIKNERQTILFSATMGNRVLKLANNITKTPKRLAVARTATTHENISQTLYMADNENHKLKLLYSILNREGVGQVIIFTATKMGAERLSDMLGAKEYSACSLHGDMRQRHRLKTIAKMRDFEFQILVATDVAARGIDLKSITHVINYDLPRTADDYTHRIGRTGRAQEKGSAITLATFSERYQLRMLEKHLNYAIPVKVVEGLEPSAKDAKTSGKNRGDRDNRDRNSHKRRGPARHGRSDRGQRGARDDRNERSDKGQSPLREDRSDRNGRAERSERFQRSDRKDRGDRSDRGQRAQRGDRNDRPVRSERPQRSDRGDRNQRPERAPRGDRNDRNERSSNQRRFSSRKRPRR